MKMRLHQIDCEPPATDSVTLRAPVTQSGLSDYDNVIVIVQSQTVTVRRRHTVSRRRRLSKALGLLLPFFVVVTLLATLTVTVTVTVSETQTDSESVSARRRARLSVSESQAQALQDSDRDSHRDSDSDSEGSDSGESDDTWKHKIVELQGVEISGAAAIKYRTSFSSSSSRTDDHPESDAYVHVSKPGTNQHLKLKLMKRKTNSDRHRVVDLEFDTESKDKAFWLPPLDVKLVVDGKTTGRATLDQNNFVIGMSHAGTGEISIGQGDDYKITFRTLPLWNCIGDSVGSVSKFNLILARSTMSPSKDGKKPRQGSKPSDDKCTDVRNSIAEIDFRAALQFKLVSTPNLDSDHSRPKCKYELSADIKHVTVSTSDGSSTKLTDPKHLKTLLPAVYPAFKQLSSKPVQLSQYHDTHIELGKGDDELTRCDDAQNDAAREICEAKRQTLIGILYTLQWRSLGARGAHFQDFVYSSHPPQADTASVVDSQCHPSNNPSVSKCPYEVFDENMRVTITISKKDNVDEREYSQLRVYKARPDVRQSSDSVLAERLIGKAIQADGRTGRLVGAIQMQYMRPARIGTRSRFGDVAGSKTAASSLYTKWSWTAGSGTVGSSPFGNTPTSAAPVQQLVVIRDADAPTSTLSQSQDELNRQMLHPENWVPRMKRMHRAAVEAAQMHRDDDLDEDNVAANSVNSAAAGFVEESTRTNTMQQNFKTSLVIMNPSYETEFGDDWRFKVEAEAKARMHMFEKGHKSNRVVGFEITPKVQLVSLSIARPLAVGFCSMTKKTSADEAANVECNRIGSTDYGWFIGLSAENDGKQASLDADVDAQPIDLKSDKKQGKCAAEGKWLWRDPRKDYALSLVREVDKCMVKATVTVVLLCVPVMFEFKLSGKLEFGMALDTCKVTENNADVQLSNPWMVSGALLAGFGVEVDVFAGLGGSAYNGVRTCWKDDSASDLMKLLDDAQIRVGVYGKITLVQANVDLSAHVAFKKSGGPQVCYGGAGRLKFLSGQLGLDAKLGAWHKRVMLYEHPGKELPAYNSDFTDKCLLDDVAEKAREDNSLTQPGLRDTPKVKKLCRDVLCHAIERSLCKFGGIPAELSHGTKIIAPLLQQYWSDSTRESKSFSGLAAFAYEHGEGNVVTDFLHWMSFGLADSLKPTSSFARGWIRAVNRAGQLDVEWAFGERPVNAIYYGLFERVNNAGDISMLERAFGSDSLKEHKLYKAGSEPKADGVASPWTSKRRTSILEQLREAKHALASIAPLLPKNREIPSTILLRAVAAVAQSAGSESVTRQVIDDITVCEVLSEIGDSTATVYAGDPVWIVLSPRRHALFSLHPKSEEPTFVWLVSAVSPNTMWHSIRSSPCRVNKWSHSAGKTPSIQDYTPNDAGCSPAKFGLFHGQPFKRVEDEPDLLKLSQQEVIELHRVTHWLIPSYELDAIGCDGCSKSSSDSGSTGPGKSCPASCSLPKYSNMCSTVPTREIEMQVTNVKVVDTYSRAGFADDVYVKVGSSCAWSGCKAYHLDDDEDRDVDNPKTFTFDNMAELTGTKLRIYPDGRDYPDWHWAHCGTRKLKFTDSHIIDRTATYKVHSKCQCTCGTEFGEVCDKFPPFKTDPETTAKACASPAATTGKS
jgi:hypothetical protein